MFGAHQRSGGYVISPQMSSSCLVTRSCPVLLCVLCSYWIDLYFRRLNHPHSTPGNATYQNHTQVNIYWLCLALSRHPALPNLCVKEDVVVRHRV